MIKDSEVVIDTDKPAVRVSKRAIWVNQVGLALIAGAVWTMAWTAKGYKTTAESNASRLTEIAADFKEMNAEVGTISKSIISQAAVLDMIRQRVDRADRERDQIRDELRRLGELIRK